MLWGGLVGPVSQPEDKEVLGLGPVCCVHVAQEVPVDVFLAAASARAKGDPVLGLLREQSSSDPG